MTRNWPGVFSLDERVDAPVWGIISGQRVFPFIHGVGSVSIAPVQRVVNAMVLAVAVGCATSESNPNEGSPEAQAAELFDACLVCHSTREMQRGPVLDGLPEWYVVEQLKKFRLGLRGRNTENKSEFLMGIATKKIGSNAQLEMLAQWIARREPQPFIHVIRGDIERGRGLYLQRCAVCHGQRGEGKSQMLSPPLNVQEDWFLLDQMRLYLANLRGTHTRDKTGMLMATAITGMDSGQARDIVAYIAAELTVTQPVERSRNRPANRSKE